MTRARDRHEVLISGTQNCIWSSKVPCSQKGFRSALRIKGSEAICAVTISDDGTTAAAITKTGIVFMFYFSANRFVRVIEGLSADFMEPGALCIPSYRQLLVAVGKSLSVIDVQARSVVQRLNGHDRKIFSTHAHASRVVSSSPECAIIWDASQWVRIHYLSLGRTSLSMVVLGCWSGCIAGAVCTEGRIHLWWTNAPGDCEILLPDVDGQTCKTRLLVLGRSSAMAVVQCEDVLKTALPHHSNLLVCWSYAAEKKCCKSFEIQHQVEHISVRDLLCGGQVVELALVLHTDGLFIIDMSICRVLFSMDVARGPHSTFDVQASGGTTALAVMLDGTGALQLQNVSIPTHLRHRPRGVPQPQQSRPSQVAAHLQPLEHLRVHLRSVRAGKSKDRQSGYTAPEYKADFTFVRLADIRLEHSQHSTNLQGLRDIIEEHGALPENSRHRAWQLLLALPRNAEAYQSLADRGIHPAFSKLHEAFPLRGQARIRLLCCLSTLAHWTPLLAQVPYLAAVAFPITQVFRAESVLTFEFLVMFFLTWGRDWLDFFPNPPIGVLAHTAELLEDTDAELYEHLTSVCAEEPWMPPGGGATSLAVLWPWMQNLLSEALEREAWCALWDHLVARWREPDLFGACVVVLLCLRRSVLLTLPRNNPGRLDAELRTARSSPSAGRVLEKAEAVLANARRKGGLDALPTAEAAPGADILGSCTKFCTSLPLPKGLSYPQLQLPVFVANYSSSERARIEAAATEVAAVRGLSTRISVSRSRLSQTDAKLKELPVNLQRERSEYSQHVREDLERLAKAQRHLDERRSSSCGQRVQRVDRGAEAALQRQCTLLEADATKFAEELQLQHNRRGIDVKHMLNSQDVLRSEQQTTQRLADRIKVRCTKEEIGHVQRLAELQQLECQALGELRKQQLQIHFERDHVRLDEHLRGRQEMQQLEEFMNMRRDVQKDLGLRALEEELQLGEELQSGVLRRAETASRIFEEESNRLQDLREQLVSKVDIRLLEEDREREQKQEQEMSARRMRADLAHELWVTDPKRAEQEEDDIFFEEQQQARVRLQRVAAQDAEAAEAAEESFRRALLELDEVRLAEAQAEQE